MRGIPRSGGRVAKGQESVLTLFPYLGIKKRRGSEELVGKGEGTLIIYCCYNGKRKC